MPPKRKSGQEADDDAQPPPRRSTRQRTSTAQTSTAQAREAAAATAPKSGAKETAAATTAVKGNPATTKAKRQKKEAKQGGGNGGETGPPRSVPSASPQGDAASGKAAGDRAEGATEEDVTTPAAAAAKTESKPAEGGKGDPSGRQYWLMKAEPETRLENGVDVRFSIDDLAARKEPEPWDGIRNFVARNNLRAMKKGDLAFFYHSNCKEPGIVGTMEIVREHSPDLTAHDPKCPYYDPKSKPSDPRWSVVHVEFREKFPVPVGLKELREMGAEGGPLRDMQVLRQSRLSVSRVSADEWAHLVGVAGEKARAQAGA